MNWIRFDFDDASTWPETNRKIVIRYRDGHQKIKYHVMNHWLYKPTDMYAKQNGFRIHTYYDEHDDPKLYHNKEKVLYSDSFITHWAYFEEPTDGYWEEYKHENGNTYADNAWVDNIPKPATDIYQHDIEPIPTHNLRLISGKSFQQLWKAAQKVNSSININDFRITPDNYMI